MDCICSLWLCSSRIFKVRLAYIHFVLSSPHRSRSAIGTRKNSVPGAKLQCDCTLVPRQRRASVENNAIASCSTGNTRFFFYKKETCETLANSLANNRFTTIKCGQFSSNLRPITPVIGIYLENKLTFTPREVQSLKLKNSGEIVEKTSFCSLIHLILALITHHAPTIVKWSICPKIKNKPRTIEAREKRA